MGAPEKDNFIDIYTVEVQLGYFFDDEVDDITDDSPYLPHNDSGVYIVREGNAMDGTYISLYQSIKN